MNGDWRSQLDELQAEYADILQFTSPQIPIYHEVDDDESSNAVSTKAEIAAMMGFNQQQIIILKPIKISLFSRLESIEESKRGHKLSIEDERIAAVNFFQASLLSNYEQCCENRIRSIVFAESISGLSSNLQGEQKTIEGMMHSVTQLRTQVGSLIEEINSITSNILTALNEFGEKSQFDNLRQRLDTLRTCGYNLRNELMQSSIMICSILERIEHLNAVPVMSAGPLDGIRPDWGSIDKVRRLQSYSFRSRNFATFMTAKCLPVCQYMHEYLQSTKKQARTLSITQYEFQSGELQAIMDFFIFSSMKKNEKTKAFTMMASSAPASSERATAGLESHYLLTDSLLHLSISSCGIGDRECHVIAMCLPIFSNLRSLSLRDNKVTTSGATSLATTMWESSLPLQSLKLDHNEVGPDGAHAIARALAKCRYLSVLSLAYNPIGDVGAYHILKKCLSKRRRAYALMPKPLEWLENEELMDQESNADDDEEEDDDGDKFDEFLDEHGNVIANLAEKLAQSAHAAGADDDFDDFSLSAGSVYSALDDDDQAPVVGAGGEGVSEGPQYAFRWKYARRMRLSRLFARVRYKLIAINAFSSLRNRGHQLTSLVIAGCQLTWFAAAATAHVTADNNSIVDIDLSDNDIGDDGAVYLAGLVRSGDLLSLRVRACGFTDDGAQALLHAAMQSPCLQSLDLSENDAGPTGINWIAAASDVFLVDHLGLGPGFRRSAPLPLKGEGDHTYTDSWDGTRGDMDDRMAERYGGMFQDDDYFEGEDDDDEEEEDDGDD